MNQKIVEKLTALDEKHWRLIGIGVILLVFALDYFLILRHQIGALTKINPEIETLRTNIERASNQVARLPNYQDQLDALTLDVGDLRKTFLSKDQISLLLEDISLLADKHHLNIEAVLPKTIEMESVLEYETTRYLELPVFIEANGGYHDFGRWLNALEKIEPIWRMDSFTIVSTGNAKVHRIQLAINAIVTEEFDPDAEEGGE
jgi:type IV pilus assembly protein PilO